MTEREYRLVVQMFSTYLERKKYALRDILIKEYEEKRNLIDFDDINRILLYDFADINPSGSGNWYSAVDRQISLCKLFLLR